MTTALIIVDVQKAMDHPKWGKRNNPDAEKKMAQLLELWRENSWPVIHVQDHSPNPDSPYFPGQPLHDFKDEVYPKKGETIVAKKTANAFVGTNLEEILQKLGVRQLVICGVHLQYCVDATVRMASCLGFEVSLVTDAVVAVETEDPTGKVWVVEDTYQLALAHLKGFANLVETQSLLDQNL